MPHSMTGFAAGTGSFDGWTWSGELRTVNGRGLDLKVRLPEPVDGLEGALRARLQASISRGSVTLTLRLSNGRVDAGTVPDPSALLRLLDQIALVERTAAERGVMLAPSRATDLLSIRSLWEAPQDAATEVVPAADLAEAICEALLPKVLAMRADEGAALAVILSAQIDRIASLTDAASARAGHRESRLGELIAAAMARIAESGTGVDPDRLAQELAIVAVKQDVTEEIDRLATHVEAARALLRQEGAIGRKLDFLGQEFNREANTLCSKSQDAELTRIGLDLKAVIEQMREQVQNLE